MKKLHSFAFCALVTPAITMGASSVLAQQSTDQDMERKDYSTQRDRGATPASPASKQGDHGMKDSKQFEFQGVADRRHTGDQSQKKNRSYLESVPANGMHASELIGANVSTKADEEVGSVSDLIIGEDGQVRAIIVGVGGFLGMGEKDVAIGWGHVTSAGTADERDLRIDVTREELRSAPEFETEV